MSKRLQYKDVKILLHIEGYTDFGRQVTKHHTPFRSHNMKLKTLGHT